MRYSNVDSTVAIDCCLRTNLRSTWVKLPSTKTPTLARMVAFDPLVASFCQYAACFRQALHSGLYRPWLSHLDKTADLCCTCEGDEGIEGVNLYFSNCEKMVFMVNGPPCAY